MGGVLLVKEMGGEPILQMTCRDRNRLALQADLLLADTKGVHTKTASDNPFFFKIKAVDTSGNESGFSNVVKVKLPDVTPPIAPVFKTFQVKEGMIELSWYPNTESDVAGYRLYRTKAGDESDKQVKLNKA